MYRQYKRSIRQVLWLQLVAAMLATPEVRAQESQLGCNRAYEPCGSTENVDAVVRIDVRGGYATLDGRRRYGTRDEVRVVLVNKNPFRYAYSVQIDEKALPAEDGALITKFLRDVKLEKKPQPSTDSSDSRIKIDSVLAFWQASNDESCTTADSSLLEDAEAHVKQGADIQSALVRRKADIGDASRQMAEDRQRLLNANAAARELWTRSRELVARARAASREIGLLLNDAAEQRQLLNVNLEDLGAGTGECDFLEKARASLKGLHKALTEAAFGAPDLKSDSARFDSLARYVEPIVDEPSGFYSAAGIVGAYDEATTATITVRRSEANDSAAKETNIGTFEFRFGSPRVIALATGPGFGWVESRNFVRQQGFAAPGDTETSNIVGLTEDSDLRIPPLLLLHLRLAHIPKTEYTVALSAGTNIGQDLTTARRDWLTGISIGIGNERGFLTLGALAGPRTSLGGNLKVGDVVPEALTELPTRLETKWGFAAALTYRID